MIYAFIKYLFGEEKVENLRKGLYKKTFPDGVQRYYLPARFLEFNKNTPQ